MLRARSKSILVVTDLNTNVLVGEEKRIPLLQRAVTTQVVEWYSTPETVEI